MVTMHVYLILSCIADMYTAVTLLLMKYSYLGMAIVVLSPLLLILFMNNISVRLHLALPLPM